MAVAFRPIRPTRHDVAGIIYKFSRDRPGVPVTRPLIEHIDLCTNAPPQRGSRSDWRVKKRFTLRVVTCRNSARVVGSEQLLPEQESRRIDARGKHRQASEIKSCTALEVSRHEKSHAVS
jgi:hypothetical protein